MKFLRGLFLFLFTVSVLMPAGTSTAQEKSSTNTAQHCLWSVKGKSNTVHLLGSIHFLKKDFYPLPKPMEQAYDKARVIVFETDIETSSSLEFQQKLLKAGTLPSGDKIQKHVSKETYALLETYLKRSVGVGQALDNFRPWLASVALLGIELQKMGYDPEHGVDKYFLKKAKKDKKQVVALETVDFQLKLFTTLTTEEQAAMLDQAVREISTYEQILGDMVSAWRTGDVAGLDKLIMDQMREYPKVYQKLLVDRNERWLVEIEKLLASEQDALVVVGAGHLVGKDSVVEMLKKKGFEVQQQ